MPKSKFDAFYYGIGMKLDEASVDEAGKKLEGKLNKVVDNVAKNLTTISEAVAKGVKDVDTKKLVKSLVDAQKELNQFQNFDPSKLQKQIDALNTTVTSLSTSLGDVGTQLKSFADDVASRLSNIEIKTSKQGRDALKSDLKEMKTLAQGYSRVLASGEKIDTSALDRYFQKIRNGFASLKASGNPMEMFADKELANYFIDLTNILRQMGTPVEDLRADFFELSSAFKGVFEKTNVSGAQTVFKNTGYQIEAVNAKLRTAQAELARYEAEMNRLQSRSKSTGFDIVINADKNLDFEAKIARIQQYGDIIAELDYGEEWATATRNQIALIQAAEKELQSLLKKKGGEKALEQWTGAFGFDLTDKFSSDAISEYVRVAQEQFEQLKVLRDKIKSEIVKYQSDIGKLTATEAVTASKKDGRSQKATTQKQKATGVVAEVEAKIKINEVQWAQTINAALSNLETKGKVKPFKIKVEATQGKILEEIKKIKDAALVDKKKDGTSDVNIFNKRFDEFYNNLKARREEIVTEMKTKWHPALKDAFTFKMELLGIDNKSLTANIGEYILTTVDVINDALSSKPLQFHTNLDALLAEIQNKVQDIKIDGNVTLGAGNVDLSTQSLGDVSISLDSTNLAREDTLSKIYNLLSVRKGGNDPQLDGRIAELRKAIAVKESEERKSLDVSRRKVAEEKKGTEEVKKKAAEEKKGADAVKKKVLEEKKETSTSNAQTKKSSKKKGELTSEEIFANRFANGKEVVEYFIGLANLGKNLNQIREIANKPITADMFNDGELEKWVRGKKYTKADVGSYAPGKRVTPEALNRFLSTMGITEADLAEANTKEEVEFLTPLKKYIYAFMQNRQKLNELLTTLTTTQSGKGVVEGYNAAQSDKTEYLAGSLSSTIKGLTPKTPTTKAQLHIADIFKKYNIDLTSLPSAKTYAEQWQIIQQQLIGKKGLDFNNLMSDLGQLKGNVGKTYENFMALLQVSRSYMETSNLLGEVGREADLLVKGRTEKVMTDRRRWNNETGQFENVERQVSRTVQQGIRGMLKQLQVVFESQTGRTLLGYNLGKGYIPEDAYQSPSGSFTSIIKSLTDALNSASKILFGERMSMLDGSKDVGRWTPTSGQSSGDAKPTQTVPEIQKWIQNTKAQIQSLEKLSDRTDEQNQRLDELKTHLANLEAQLKTSGGNVTYTRGGKTVTYDQAVVDLPRIQSQKQNAEQSLANLRLGYDSEHISFLTDLQIQRQSGAITQENFDLIMKLVPKISDLNKQLLNGSITQEKYIETISNAYALMRKASTDEAKNVAKLDAKKLADTINLVKAYQEEEKTLQKIIKTQKGKTSDENKQQKASPVSQTKKKKIESETGALEANKKVEDARQKAERDAAEKARRDAETRAKAEEKARIEAERRAQEEKKRTEEAAKQAASEKQKTTEGKKQVASEKTETQESKKQITASQEFEDVIKRVLRDLLNALSGEQVYKISGGRVTPTPEQLAKYKTQKDNALNSLMNIFGVESKDIDAFAQSILPKNAAFRNGFGASGKTINSIYGNLISQYGSNVQNPDKIVSDLLNPVKQVLHKEVSNLFAFAHKMYQETAAHNRIFRELSFATKNGVIDKASLGLIASVPSRADKETEALGHLHPSNSMYSSEDIKMMEATRQHSLVYNKDVLITPDFVYQLTDMSKVGISALAKLRESLEALEHGLNPKLTTKAKESVMSYFAQENGISFSKSTYDDMGRLTDITNQTPIISKDALDALIQYTKEAKKNKHDPGADYATWQERKKLLYERASADPLVKSLMVSTPEERKANRIYQSANYQKIRSGTLIQEAVDYDFDLSLFIQQFKDFFEAIDALGEKVKPNSSLGKLQRYVQEIDSAEVGSDKYKTLIDKIKFSSTDVFKKSETPHIDKRFLDELYEIAKNDEDAKINKTILSERLSGKLRETVYKDNVSNIDNMSLDDLKAELANLERLRDEGEVDPRFATAEKQDVIINLLKNGIKVSGKVEGKTGSGGGKSGTKTPKIPNTGKADTQFDAISQLDGLNPESALYKRYMSAKSQLDDALSDAKSKGKNFTTDDANKIKALSTEVTKLGRKIIEASSSLEQFKSRGGQAFTSTANEAKTLKDEMLELAYQNASASKMLLSDVSYDEVTQKMTYNLTDLEGNVTRVAMAYNDLFGSILTMSNKTTNSVGKIYKTIEGEMTNRIGVNDIVNQTPILGESNEYQAYLDAYNSMMDAQDALRVKGEIATKEEKDDLISLTREVANTRGEFEKLVKASAEFDTKVRGGATETLTSGFDMSSLSDKMKEFVLNSNSWTQSQRNMIEQTWNFKDAQNGATYSVVDGKKQLASMSVIFDEGTRRIGQYTVETKKYQTGFEKFMTSLGGKWQEVARYLMSFGSLYRVWAVLQQGVQYVREIDSALTELKKVTDETEESYERFLNTAANTADKVGSTIKEIVSSTADWSRLGYGMEEAHQLAESTAVLLNVSEFQSIDDATSALTSTLQAFGYTANQSMEVVDVMNEVGNNFAISSDGIATALQDSASSLMAANNSYQEAVALIAAANRVVQDPNSVGAALRTISLRLRGTSTEELEEAGEETDGAINSKSKLRSKIKGYTGIDILTDSGAYKSTYEILLEISKVWDNLTDMDRAGLLEMIAGKTRSNTAAAILSNTKDLKEAYKSAMEAEGSAYAENEKYLDSIQGRIDLFTNSVQTMWSNTLDSDVVKFFVDVGTQLVKWVDRLGLIKTLAMAIGTYLIQKNFKGDLFGGLFGAETTANIDNMKSKLQHLRTEYEKAQNAYDNNHTKENKKYLDKSKKQYEKYDSTVGLKIKEYDDLENKLSSLKEKRQSLVDDISNNQQYEDYLGSRMAAGYDDAAGAIDKVHTKNEQLKGQLEQVDQEIINTETALQNVEIQAQSTGNAGLSAGQKFKTGFKTAGKAVWQFGKEMLKSMATAYVISTILELVTKLGHGLEWLADQFFETPEKAQEKFEELNAELSEVTSELSSLRSELDSTQDRIDALMSQGSLSFMEQEELDRLQAENDELERKIKLNESLEKTKQQNVNNAAINATDKYLYGTSFASDVSKTEKQENWSNVGETIGKAGGLAAGAALAIKFGAAGTLFGGPVGAFVGAALGAIIGGFAGSAIGSGLAGASYDSEETVGEAMDNMIAKRKELKAIQDEALADKDAEAYNNATEALNTYDTQMAKHISQIQENYNAMDWDTTSPEDRKVMMEYADWLDKYNINMKTEGAKTSAVSRIFGIEASDDIKHLKEDIEDAMEIAKQDGTDPNFDFQTEIEGIDGLKQRLYDMGLTVTDVKYYFLDLAKAEKEAEDSYSTYDTVKQINTLSDGVNSLKDAFSEITEEGYVSTETLVALEEKFGGLDDSWENFVDTVATGTGSIREATDAINGLLEAYLTDQLSKGPMGAEEQLKTIMLLQQLGVKNAKEYIDAMQKASMVESIANKVIKSPDVILPTAEEQKEYDDLINFMGPLTSEQWSRLNELSAKGTPKDMQSIIADYETQYGIDLSKEEEALLIEKAITAERAKQAAIEAEKQQTTREGLLKEKEMLEELAKGATDGTATNSALGIEENTVKGQAAGSEYEITSYKYNGQTYDTLEQAQQAAAQDLEKKANAIKVPSEVDAEGLKKSAEDAQKDLEKAFDDMGLSVDVELEDFDTSIDRIQDAYSTLKDVTEQYNKTGYLTLDNLQSLLSLSPEYLAVLQMENGQLSINQQALEAMIQTKLAEAKATVVQNAITQLNALANRESADAINNSSVAASNAIGGLGEYANVLGIVSQNAIVGAGAVTAFNNAVAGAQANELVSQEEIDTIMSNMENQLAMIDSVATNLPTQFANIVSPGSSGTDATEDAFQKAMDYWENRIGANQARYEQVQNEIDLLEKKGKIAGKEYYEEQIKLEDERLKLLEAQKKEAEGFLGKFAEGSDEWWDVANQLNDLAGEIDDVTASIQDLYDAQAEVDWKIFDEAVERFNNLHDELSTIRDLLAPNGEEDWFDDEGMWTDKGVASLATYVQQLHAYDEALKQVSKKLDDDYSLPYAGNETHYKALGIDSEQELYDAREKLKDQQYDYAKAISDTQQSVADMYESQIDAVEEYTNELVESYNDYIDVVKEALDAERDYTLCKQSYSPLYIEIYIMYSFELLENP